jgi:hypothetical protein
MKFFYDFPERAEVLRSSNVLVMIHDRQLGRPDYAEPGSVAGLFWIHPGKGQYLANGYSFRQTKTLDLNFLN